VQNPEEKIHARENRGSERAMAKQKEEGSGEWEDKAENAWSYYTAQAQEIGRKALQSKDDALKTAKSQLGQLQDASSHHLTTAQNIAHTVSQQYAVYEDIFFSKLKEGVHTISRYPNVAYGVLGVTTLLALRSKYSIIQVPTFLSLCCVYVVLKQHHCMHY
jgi:hypothetical protein